MKKPRDMTDTEIEIELARLKNSKYVKLAQKEQHIKYKERQYLYALRSMEKRGKELAGQGLTISNISKRMAAQMEEALLDADFTEDFDEE